MPQLPPNRLKAGTKAGQDTTGAQITTTRTPCNGVTVQNDPDNSVDLLVGDVDAQTLQLAPGDGVWIAIDDVAKVYSKAASGTATVNWLAVNTG